ncbi:Na+/H+ antiporter NhaA [Neomegalonema sp.]|uniref:Na+/H+ antiporter NhaA n=1 Tax=Neomegalonema sp. TaxID=2039713 RepID=UPI00261C304C|nr:Na+/H+ antiporter NhaA [Neomegalonema sp.]MDD2867492.1 Na+/H+ antiporter NhaA [Neomegalonema sp.]
MRFVAFIREYSLLLLGGALTGLIWANLSPLNYHHFIESVLADDSIVGQLHDGRRTLTLHYLINDLLMALFFAMAGKEVWEAVALKGGALRGRKALTPLIATAGGVIGPICVYLLGAMLIGQMSDLGRGWAIPTATDIAFSYLVGRLVFGARHPAVAFLLLLAIADDAVGLIILAIFYPTGELQPLWLVFSFAMAGAAWLLFNRLPRLLDGADPLKPRATWIRDRLSFWPYLVFGALCWWGFQQAGIHPALGLLPMIPAIPHADARFGRPEGGPDLLNRMEHALKPFVDVILFFFGLANAGVQLSAMGAATWLVLAGLLIGKPLGIALMGWIAARPLGLGLPEGMRMTDLAVLGCVAAVGFTVALFVAGVAFPSGHEHQDSAKMGALLSFAAAILALAAGRLFRVEKRA